MFSSSIHIEYHSLPSNLVSWAKTAKQWLRGGLVMVSLSGLGVLAYVFSSQMPKQENPRETSSNLLDHTDTNVPSLLNKEYVPEVNYSWVIHHHIEPINYPATLELSSLSEEWGLKLIGELTDDWNGYSVTGLGDINGDGVDDLGMGAPLATIEGRFRTGVSYVVFGKGGSWSSQIELSTLDGANGFKLIGEASSDYSGSTVSGIGDINGDGLADIAVGAPLASPHGRLHAGSSYVIFGKNGSWVSPIELSSINGINGIKLHGEAIGDQSGYSISGAGDINGDKIADFIIGASSASSEGRNKSGSSYVVFGKKTAWVSDFELSTLNGMNGFKLNGELAGDFSGNSVSGAGDINSDGVDDLIIGAFASPAGRSQAGTSYVIFGHQGNWASPLQLSNLTGSNGFKINGEVANDWSGGSVSGVGDINGDGIDDIAIGASSSSPGGRLHSGTSYVLFGKNSSWTSSIELSGLNGVNGFKIHGEAQYDYSGTSVSYAGDINHDGIADLIIGAFWASPHGHLQAGASYVVLGRSGNWPNSVELSHLNGINGFRLNGEKINDTSGSSVSGVGDFNNDGITDVIIGAPAAPAIKQGSCYVIFGGKIPNHAHLSQGRLPWAIGGALIGVIALISGVFIFYEYRSAARAEEKRNLNPFANGLVKRLNLGISDFESISGALYVDAVEKLVNALEAKGIKIASATEDQLDLLIQQVAQVVREHVTLVPSQYCGFFKINKLSIYEFNAKIEEMCDEIILLHNRADIEFSIREPGNFQEAKTRDIGLSEEKVLRGSYQPL